jgi:hypothetical protein
MILYHFKADVPQFQEKPHHKSIHFCHFSIFLDVLEH